MEFHILPSYLFYRRLFPFFRSQLDIFLGTRVRIHIGSHQEVQYSLLALGVPTKFFPISSDGLTVKKSYCKQWYKRQQSKEAYYINVRKQQLQQKQHCKQSKKRKPLAPSWPGGGLWP